MANPGFEAQISHQVLARKWRPGRFEDLIGQPHVVRALVNALQHDRLHHAYLFSGTRGVGKTTVARILARCLNCETGVTATPCGHCGACVEIAQGRHLDLIEVDAASRTRVDDTRELLDNVAYAPVSGRYKVYLIDEVHMLSEKSFNALLKTLEEPPPHVKFLLATTDPQKLPITVLSRCLQFNLKPMSPSLIAEHLGMVLAAEGIEAETGALARLAEAAEGSMRDALSLTDQAIAYAGAGLTETDICDMIGLLPRTRLSELLDAAWAGAGARMLQILQELDALAPDWSRLLDELASLVHGVAVQQVLAMDTAAPAMEPSAEPLVAWQRTAARRQAPEDVQLAYQILLQGGRDLPYAPDARIGVEMTLLRILAFRPDAAPTGVRNAASPKAGRDVDRTAAPDIAPDIAPDSAPGRAHPGPASATTAAPVAQPVPAAADRAPEPPPRAPVRAASPVQAPPGATAEPYAGQEAAAAPDTASAAGNRISEPAMLDWHAFAQGLAPGPVRELALHASLLDCVGDKVTIAVQSAHRMLCTERRRERLSAALAAVLNRVIRLDVKEQAEATATTPAARLAADAADRQSSVEAEVRADPALAALQQTFGAEVARVQVRDAADDPHDPEVAPPH